MLMPLAMLRTLVMLKDVGHVKRPPDFEDEYLRTGLGKKAMTGWNRIASPCPFQKCQACLDPTTGSPAKSENTLPDFKVI